MGYIWESPQNLRHVRQNSPVSRTFCDFFPGARVPVWVTHAALGGFLSALVMPVSVLGMPTRWVSLFWFGPIAITSTDFWSYTYGSQKRNTCRYQVAILSRYSVPRCMSGVLTSPVSSLVFVYYSAPLKYGPLNYLRFRATLPNTMVEKEGKA